MQTLFPWAAPWADLVPLWQLPGIVTSLRPSNKKPILGYLEPARELAESTESVGGKSIPGKDQNCNASISTNTGTYALIILSLPSFFHIMEQKLPSLWFWFVRLKEQQWKKFCVTVCHANSEKQIEFRVWNNTLLQSCYTYLHPALGYSWVWFALCPFMISEWFGSDHIFPRRGRSAQNSMQLTDPAHVVVGCLPDVAGEFYAL